MSYLDMDYTIKVLNCQHFCGQSPNMSDTMHESCQEAAWRLHCASQETAQHSLLGADPSALYAKPLVSTEAFGPSPLPGQQTAF